MLHRFGLFSTYMLQKHFIGNYKNLLQTETMQWFSFQQTADEKYTWDMNYNTKKRNYTIAHGIHNMVWALFILLNIGAKWPITINFGNNLSNNTVSEQYRDLPLFLVLELGELEYHVFLIHLCWHGNFN